MNRRGFFKRLGMAVGAALLPISVISYDPVKQQVSKPKTDHSFLVGYRGHQFFESGIVYAPYIPIYRTPTIVLA